MNKPYECYKSGEYLSNNPTWDEEDSEWKANQVLKLIVRNHLSVKSIVEVGCGAGGILAHMNTVLPDVSYSGFEIAPEASKFWKKYQDTGIQFEVSDFLVSGNRHYDLLLLLDVVEHLVDPFDFLTKIRDRADYFVFHLPLDLSASSVIRENPLLHVRKKVGHIHYFTKNLAFSLLDECQFEVVDWGYTGGKFDIKKTSIFGALAQLFRMVFNQLNKDLSARLFGGQTLIVLGKRKI